MMKKEELKKINDRYLEGLSSLEEEKRLKEEGDFFFQVLKEEKEQHMDLSFDEFLTKVPMEKNVIKIWDRAWFRIGVAAILLAILGVALYLPDGVEQRGQQVRVIPDKRHPQELRTAQIERQPDREVESTLSSDKYLPVRHIQAKKREKALQKVEKMPAQEANAYQADYVVLNGEPVANEEEAVELTLKSLGLLANNLENTMDKMMNIKQMSITIN